MAGFLGREQSIALLRDHAIPKTEAYNVTMSVMAALLVIGFFANLA